jgi:hypothetical protein
MAWVPLETTPGPRFAWQARLTAAHPDPGWLTLSPLTDPTVQIEGTFGTGEVTLGVSNSGLAVVPVEVLRHSTLQSVIPATWLMVSLLHGDETTDLVVTVAGRR